MWRFLPQCRRTDQYAIDIGINVATIITASRAGNVVFLEESGFDGGLPNNLVVVRHLDGPYAQYILLTNQGARVHVGLYAKIGDVIGLIGSIGLARYPHLYFGAAKSGSWQYPYISFPTTFCKTDENPRVWSREGFLKQCLIKIIFKSNLTVYHPKNE